MHLTTMINRFYSLFRAFCIYDPIKTYCLREVQGLFLDVGSGHDPFLGAHILCDLYPKNSFQRGKQLETYGKPFIACDGQFLPFRDGIFGFVHCSHVLEHVENPKLMFAELKRVAIHGWIETPSWFYENVLYGHGFHKWVIKKKGYKLFYQKPRRLRIYDACLVPLGFVFFRLYMASSMYRGIHILLDRCFHLFTVKYSF